MKTATAILVLCVAALLSLGMVILYSSSMADRNTHYLQNQMMWCAFGLVSCLIMANVDYRLLKKFAWPILAVAVILLIVVLIPIPHALSNIIANNRINGARRWFIFHHSIRFQPSELGKLALIIAVARYGEYYQRQLGEWKKGLVYPGLLIGFVLALICIEPDRGTTILMASVTAAILFVGGARWKFIVPPIILGIAGFLASLIHDPMRTKRIFAWLDVDKHKMDVGYQAYQATLGLGSGGWFGLGLGNSRQKLGFLPEHNTDFIFSIIGEELGLIATLLVVLTFVILIASGIYISSRSNDAFGLLLGTGITFLIGLQAFINIGVVTSTLPNKGLPLPFISYGGSNLLMMLTSVGVLLSIAKRARVVRANALNEVELEGVPQPT